MRDVAILGVGTTKFGELWDKSFRDGFAEAGIKAIADAGISGKDLEAIYVGNMSAGRFIEQEHIGPLVADSAGLADLGVPATRIEGACASGALAFRQGVLAVGSGLHDIVVVAGVEKMTDVPSEEAEAMLASAGDREWEGFQGATLAALYAMMARVHMQRFGTTREQMAQVSVKNHLHASKNPDAQFRSAIKLEAVLGSPMVADPLRVLDGASLADGSAAVVLAPIETAKKRGDSIVTIAASAQASASLALHDRPDLAAIPSIGMAGKRAFQMAKIEPKDVDVAELHDIQTIAEIIALEELGFCPRGQGGKFTAEGRTTWDSDLPVNPGGGLKGCGHPPGATGVRQIVELTLQLRGKAGERQVPNADIGLAECHGGTGGSAAVHILRRHK